MTQQINGNTEGIRNSLLEQIRDLYQLRRFWRQVELFILFFVVVSHEFFSFRGRLWAFEMARERAGQTPQGTSRFTVNHHPLLDRWFFNRAKIFRLAGQKGYFSSSSSVTQASR